MPIAFHVSFHPNYFFTCPNCGKRIEVIIDFEKVNRKPDAEIFLNCLPPGGCRWCGELPMSKGVPMPGIPRGHLRNEKLFARWPGFLPALCQHIEDFVGVLKWFQRAGEACEDSGKWLAVETIVRLEPVVSAGKLPSTGD
ncbi:MAG: hypothetical protein WCF30_17285 [Terracidiphilus sp.]